MASVLPMRRQMTRLASRAAKQSSTPALFYSSTTVPRRFTQQAQTVVGLTKTRTPTPTQHRARFLTQSIRWRSDKGETPSLRQWGFEDINASLPAESASSPSQSPQKDLILVDVREPAELTATGIIPSAVCVPLASQPDALFLTPEEFETRFGFAKPGAEGQDGDVVFYCKAGVRARAAAQLAVQAGYDPARVGVYEGSWLDWADKRGKVEKWDGQDYE
ncbi:hypothetical protein FE257_012388 [Aspergillus nanangensis]|uniref:Rhodanese domain-containing protein n=1 Tax=Aspergillus nanangensis TaxID=2582783 RepID=A0AAD4GQS4_ASPNN|nr:hypothetical protein FE257_012388 [Aspergillus nanangensis]